MSSRLRRGAFKSRAIVAVIDRSIAGQTPQLAKQFRVLPSVMVGAWGLDPAP
jgi:hypothetical protein